MMKDQKIQTQLYCIALFDEDNISCETNSCVFMHDLLTVLGNLELALDLYNHPLPSLLP